jgi:hypothetical protein
VIKIKSEMGGACSTYGERRGAYRVLVEKDEERDHLEDLGINGRIIKMVFQETRWQIVERIDLDQDMDRWRIVVKTVLNLGVL